MLLSLRQQKHNKKGHSLSKWTGMSKPLKISFTTNLCSHYRIKTFELLSSRYDVDYYFFSAGTEWYWKFGKSVGNFNYEYLPGIQIKNTRITPTLPWKLLTKPYDVYIKCINGRFALPITFIIAKLRRKPFILWTGIWTRIQTPFHRMFFPITHFIYAHSDAIVTYGEHVNRFLISEGIPAERIFSTTHAVDNDSYNRVVSQEEKDQLYTDLRISKDQKIILYLGRLEESKGAEYLVKAFAACNRTDAVLVIAGNGSEFEKLKDLAAKNQITERVRFTGTVPIEKSILYYSAATAFVLPSITMPEGKEPWGLVVNEAFNQGVPVIATDAVGAAAGGLVIDGQNGMVIPEKDVPALTNAINRVLDDPAFRQELSENAKKKVESWNNEGMILGFSRVIDYVTKNNRPKL